MSYLNHNFVNKYVCFILIWLHSNIFNLIKWKILQLWFQVLYTGKSQALGIKQGGPAAGKWTELSITKSPKMASFAVGHEGQHALLVTEDGAIFFVGTPKRGEDGDASLCKFCCFM